MRTLPGVSVSRRLDTSLPLLPFFCRDVHFVCRFADAEEWPREDARQAQWMHRLVTCSMTPFTRSQLPRAVPYC